MIRFRASIMVTKSCRASPVSRLINSLRSSLVARSFFRNTGKRAGLRPAPFRLPPWVDLGTFRLLLAHTAARVRRFIVASVKMAVVGFKNLHTFPAVSPIFAASGVPCSLAALFANERRLTMRISGKSPFEFYCHCFISFYKMNTVYHNQDELIITKSLKRLQI